MQVINIERAKILENTKIAKDTYRMRLFCRLAGQMQAGQFVNIKIEGLMLRRPISISLVEDENHFVIVYKVVGKGTKLLSELAPAIAGKSSELCKTKEQTLDILGPLGNGYPICEDQKEVLIIGGGVGIPPLLELAKRYNEAGAKVTCVLGFNDKESVFYEDEFKRLGADVYVATMDGSYGTSGTALDAINENALDCDFVCACGPVPMLKAVEAKYKRGYMSFEARMACGIGACMACVAKDKKEENLYHRICKEGPVFPIGKVEF